MGMSDMEFKCDYSKLSLPNDITYLTVASNYVGEIATKFGFDRQGRSTIEEGIREVLGRIVHYSFEPAEKAEIEIACERVPEGLKVVISDQGLPLDPASPPMESVPAGIGQDAEGLSWLELFSKYMDEVYFLNLGHRGKQTILIKHARGQAIEDYFQACELGPYSIPPQGKRRDETRFSIRQMEPRESVEVAKAIYKAYGYSYAVEHLYYPERIEEYNRAGSMLSMVAVTDGNEIAAHGALVRRDRWPRIVEMGQGVVTPEFRGHGCFNLLSGEMVEKARSLGYMGVFSQAVTVHPFSQQTVHKSGLRDCAIKLGYGPAYHSYKGIREKLSQRITLVLDFKYLSEPPNLAIYPPLHHLDMILKLYNHLGFEPQVLTPKTTELPAVTSSITSWAYARPGLGEMEVERFGKDIVPEVRRRLKEMCVSKIEMITLWLGLSDPAVFHLTEAFEAMGFFFAGILPGAGAGDALILQYLNNMALDYHEIRLESDMAKELLLYIRDRDPNVVD
jgi:anti-sigma regulatory factor (Ser/Thr protein kinase)